MQTLQKNNTTNEKSFVVLTSPIILNNSISFVTNCIIKVEVIHIHLFVFAQIKYITVDILVSKYLSILLPRDAIIIFPRLAPCGRSPGGRRRTDLRRWPRRVAPGPRTPLARGGAPDSVDLRARCRRSSRWLGRRHGHTYRHPPCRT